jgi:hypothetical protein
VTVKRSGKESRWAEVPPARTRFAAEAAFLILVAAGAAFARLSPLSIIGLMLVAWLLVALIERASSREHARTFAADEETDVLAMPAEEPAASGVEGAAVEKGRLAERLLFWRQKPGAAALAAPTEALEERPSRSHVRRVEPEPEAAEPEPEPTEPAVVEPSTPGPAVTTRRLDLPGLEEPETARTAARAQDTPPAAEAPPPDPPPEPPPVEPPAAAPREERRPPPPAQEPPRAPAAPPPPREWNIWELEREARARSGDAVKDEQWAALFIHLRQYANADGVLPLQFDDLVRESFSELIQAA